MGVLLVRPALPDDPIVTRAMKASTIVEIYVETKVLHVELEIAVSDLKAFANVIPDDLYKRLGLPARPIDQRLRDFFQQDWVLRDQDGQALMGQVVSVNLRRRVPRDEITGLPLPSKKGVGKPVVFMKLRYPLTTRPERLTIRPPIDQNKGSVRASIGFVVYHQGLPVNDFRYLGSEEILDLDWKDPWFSRFRNRNLWRRYLAPISTFLYAFRGEVRKEIVLRPVDLQRWVDLGLEGRSTIPVDMQEELKRRVVEFLAPRNPVLIDGRKVVARLDRIHFLRRSLRMTGVIQIPEELDIHSATLGVIFAYEIEGLPEKVTMTWDLFHPKFPKVPAIATDEAGGLPAILTKEDPVLEWRNFLTNPSQPGVQAVMPPPPAWRLALPIVGWITGLLTVTLGVLSLRKIRLDRRMPWAPTSFAVFALIISATSFTLGTQAITPEASKQVLQVLLHNIYRAFDHRDESIVYDILAQSVDGDLLSKIYLETRRSLRIEQQGGAQAKVKQVQMLETMPKPLDGERGFEARGSWLVLGSVGHWGHIHERRLKYLAHFSVRAIDGVWKITGLDVLDEQRVL